MAKNHLYFRLLHTVHLGLASVLAYACVIALIFFYVFSPIWLRQVEASGYSAFSQSSFWNTRIPRYTTLHSDNAALAQQVQSQVSAFGTGFDTADLASPVYTVEASEPTQAVIPWDCDGNGIDPQLASDWQAVPVPTYAQPGDSPTHPMIIYQPQTGTVWEFSYMQKIGVQWQACHGGKIDGIGASDGVFSGSRGVTASGLALLGGQVSLAELKNGAIGHAVGLRLPLTQGQTWPAVRPGGSGGSLAMGQRLQLDPTINVDALGLSRGASLIAKAAQKYGFVIWDIGSTVSIAGENPKSATVRGLPDPYGGLGSMSLAGFPWASLRILPDNFAQSPLVPVISSFESSRASVTSDETIDLKWSANNVDECAIPGVASGVAAAGELKNVRVKATSVYTLSCSGPSGAVSQQLDVSATPITTNDPLPQITTTTIAQPVSRNSFVIPGLDDPKAGERIHKVEYYQRGAVLYATTTPPYRLETTKLADGPYTLAAKIYYRDGHQENQTLKLRVQNQPENILLPTNFAAFSQRPIVSPTVYALASLGAFVTAFMTSWYGWHRFRPSPAVKSRVKRPYI